MKILASVLVVLMGFLPGVARAETGPPGITTPVKLPAFDPAAPGCTPPHGLAPVLVFVRDNDRDFMLGVDRGLALAARDAGLGYRSLSADNEAGRVAREVDALVDEGIGAMVVAPMDPVALAPHLQAMIWSGGYVGTIVPPPAITILNAPQYLTGKRLGDAAAAYIVEELGGSANVVLLTQDSMQFLAPRFAAIRDSLAAVPRAVIVADISPLTVNKAGGFTTMQTILLAEPKIDVVLGADTVVLGALAATREAGLARPDQFFGGIDGEPDAVAELRSGDGPYKASISLAAPVFGYAMGRHAADWLAGRSIPQAIDILPIALTAETLASYEADMANPGAVYADPAWRDIYLRFYGNICHDSRHQYLNFPWSSEAE